MYVDTRIDVRLLPYSEHSMVYVEILNVCGVCMCVHVHVCVE